MSLNNDFVKLGLIIVGAIVLFMVLNKYSLIANEGYDTLVPGSTLPVAGVTAPMTAAVPSQVMPTSAGPLAPVQADPVVAAVPVLPSPPIVPQAVDGSGSNVIGAWSGQSRECYPKDTLTAQELLPTDKYSKWNAVNPGGTGDLGDKNFLSAGYLSGLDSVGNSKKLQSYDLRGNGAPNPQISVSPWLNSTYGPELGRKTFEVGGSC